MLTMEEAGKPVYPTYRIQSIEANKNLKVKNYLKTIFKQIQILKFKN